MFTYKTLTHRTTELFAFILALGLASVILASCGGGDHNLSRSSDSKPAESTEPEFEITIQSKGQIDNWGIIYILRDSKTNERFMVIYHYKGGVSVTKLVE